MLLLNFRRYFFFGRGMSSCQVKEIGLINTYLLSSVFQFCSIFFFSTLVRVHTPPSPLKGRPALYSNSSLRRFHSRHHFLVLLIAQLELICCGMPQPWPTAAVSPSPEEAAQLEFFFCSELHSVFFETSLLNIIKYIFFYFYYILKKP